MKRLTAGSRFTGLSKGLVRTRGAMNKSEAAYAQYLQVLMSRGEVAKYWFEPFSIRISVCDSGQPARYTPDFLVLGPNGETYVDDVKTPRGFDDNAAMVRLKVAASQYSLWVFRVVRPKGGGFEIKVV